MGTAGSGEIRRSRLIGVLAARRDVPALLVEAASGYGKSTLGPSKTSICDVKYPLNKDLTTVMNFNKKLVKEDIQLSINVKT